VISAGRSRTAAGSSYSVANQEPIAISAAPNRSR
jgi:hypothetical protein